MTSDRDVTTTLTTLTIDTIRILGSAAVVGGATGLPDGAVIHVDLNRAYQPSRSTYLVAAARAKAAGGRFAVEMPLPPLLQPSEVRFKTVPESLAYSRPYEASALFTPNADQPAAVSEAVGLRGERLAGGAARDSGLGCTVLSCTSLYGADAEAARATPTTLVPARRPASPFAEGTPEHATLGFLRAWHEGDWDAMFSWCDAAWARRRDSTPWRLEAWFGIKDLFDAEVLACRVRPASAAAAAPGARTPPPSAEVELRVRYAVGPRFYVARMPVRLLRRSPGATHGGAGTPAPADSPNAPDAQARWGVNPPSVLKEEEWRDVH